MRILINQDEYPAVPIGQWTYEEADQVLRVTGLTVGAVEFARLQGNAAAGLAFAVVGWLRIHPGKDPGVLRQMQIDQILVDFRDETPEDEEDPDGPPAAAGGDAGDQDANRGRSRSRGKSSTSSTRATRGRSGNR